MTTPSVIGQQVHLGSFLVNTHVYGVVTPPDTPDQFSATFEIMGDQGTLMTAALVGPQGPPGQHAFALRLQVSSIDDPDNLPTSLTNSQADIGKYWLIDDIDSEGNIIGSSAYIWYGTSFRRMMMGTPGPPGATPIITPSIELLDPDGDEESDVLTSGTTLYPQMLFRLKVPKGPPGPSAMLATCPDVDFSTPPADGDVLMYNAASNKWKPKTLAELTPTVYSVPESAFSNYSGLSQRATIGTFAIPPQAFDFVPIVWGHIQAGGLELDPSPLTIGCEVRLGDPVTGTLVARGFGSTLNQTTLLPHFSWPAQPTKALTPTNGLARVPANHSNTAQGTLYINLYNDGIAGLYVYNSEDSQLFVQCNPV